MIIYKITNIINDKIYIGKTIRTLEERWYYHLHPPKTCKSRLFKAIIKYGASNFKIETIHADIQDEAKLNELEMYYINLYNSTNIYIGYNITKGGDGGPVLSGKENGMYGKKRPDLVALNKSRTGIKLTQEHKDKINPTGRKHSPETIIKFKKPRGKMNLSDETRKIHADRMRGNSYFTTPIICTTNNRVYNSIAEASDKLNLSYHTIRSILSGKGNGKRIGYYFSYAKDVPIY